MSDETTLLPCPFCGGEAETVGDDCMEWIAECVECCASSMAFATEAEAIAAWNARAERGTLTAEQVREAVEASTWAETSTIREFNDSSWQAIADELNARSERTCRNEHGHCSICGAIMYDAPNYCQNCGRKAVDA